MTGDTLVSVLTPPGSGAIATVALRGPIAWDSVQRFFRPAKGTLPGEPEIRRVWFGNFGEGTGDEVILAVKAPDEFEIHCHGGIRVVRWIVEQLVAAGCVESAAFEFDRSGVDPRALEPLTQATTLRTAAILLDQYNGAFLRSDPASLRPFASLGRHLVVPWKIVIAGPPNVGKSSLINALAGFQRSVVAPIPGTTRDVVRVRLAFEGWPVELSDTAGLRIGAGELESAGIAKARAEYTAADLRIWVVDLATESPGWPSLEPAPEILVGNKVDAAVASVDHATLIPVSATRGDGLPQLIAAIVRHLVPIVPPPGAGVPFTSALCDAVATFGKFDTPL